MILTSMKTLTLLNFWEKPNASATEKPVSSSLTGFLNKVTCFFWCGKALVIEKTNLISSYPVIEETLSASLFCNSKKKAKVSCVRLLYDGLNLRICHTCCFLETGNISSNESRLEYRQKMVCTLKSDNFEFQSDDVSSNKNKKLPLWKRNSPHEFELILFANSQSARSRL